MHVVIQIEGSSYRLRQHADLLPEHVRSKATITRHRCPSGVVASQERRLTIKTTADHRCLLTPPD